MIAPEVRYRVIVGAEGADGLEVVSLVLEEDKFVDRVTAVDGLAAVPIDARTGKGLIVPIEGAVGVQSVMVLEVEVRNEVHDVVNDAIAAEVGKERVVVYTGLRNTAHCGRRRVPDTARRTDVPIRGVRLRSRTRVRSAGG